MVAQVKQLVQREAVFADRIQPHVDLQPLSRLLQVGEPCLALAANGHQPPGHLDCDAVFFEFFPSLARILSQDLWNTMRSLKLVWIGQLPQGRDLAQLLNAFSVYFFV